MNGTREHGAIIIDGNQAHSTQQCCHCGTHFVMKPGSGIVRGFCRRCMQVTCGRPECDACIPFERKLEMYEKGKIASI